MADWDVSTLGAALSGLRDRAQELADVPMRLHDHAVQPSDLLGGPRIASKFWRHLTGSVNATTTVRDERVCVLSHGVGVDCPACGGIGVSVATRDVYARPLSRAFAKLARAKTRQRPHPALVISALLAERFDVDRTAARLGIVITSPDQRKTEEARILSAIRALRSRVEDTVLGPVPRHEEEGLYPAAASR